MTNTMTKEVLAAGALALAVSLTGIAGAARAAGPEPVALQSPGYDGSTRGCGVGAAPHDDGDDGDDDDDDASDG